MTRDCTRCGKCCTNQSYMGSLQATGDDVKRWRKEGREDILRFAVVMGLSDENPWADLWLDQDHPDLPERLRCPFVRKDRNRLTYTCTIYETRPQVCRDYVAWAAGSVCEEVG